jgi:hypothetical protein
VRQIDDLDRAAEGLLRDVLGPLVDGFQAAMGSQETKPGLSDQRSRRGLAARYARSKTNRRKTAPAGGSIHSIRPRAPSQPACVPHWRGLQP